MKRLSTLSIEEISGVDDPANELPGWMVTKSRGGANLLDTVKGILFAPRGLSDFSDETLTKAVEQYGYAVPLIASGDVEVIKGRHATRAPQGTFQQAEPETNIDGVTFRHTGAVHETLRRLAAARGKREPANENKPNAGVYGNDDTQNPGHA